MKLNTPYLVLATAVAGAIAVPTLSFAQGKKAPKPVAVSKLTYDKNIKATMTKACAGCHTGAGAPEGIDLSSYAAVMKGGKKGKVIVAGNPAKSVLYTVLKGKPKLMPPKHALDAKTIAAVEQWIKQGAKEK